MGSRWFILFIAVTSMSLAVFFAYQAINTDERTIEPCQIWRWDEKDPFADENKKDYMVLEVKDGYAKYINLRFSEDHLKYGGFYNSSRVWFFDNMKLIEKTDYDLLMCERLRKVKKKNAS